MTKQELIKKYKTLSDEIFIKHFKFVARAKVERAKAQIELLKEQNREYIRQNNKLVALMRKMGLVVADLKSPSATFRDDLRHEIDTDFTSDAPVQSLLGDPVLATIEVSDHVNIPGTNTKKSKEKY